MICPVLHGQKRQELNKLVAEEIFKNLILYLKNEKTVVKENVSEFLNFKKSFFNICFV